ncbi:MAG: hypothetical protein M0C28_24635 [Candidatus Moduliflexus flocculans]|nr:hypothetical protein [Candidatus Moduliflexus flocculans]
MIGAAFDERPLLQSRGQAKFGRTLLTFYVLKLQLCFLFEDYPQARETAAAMQALMQSYSGALGQPFYCLYAALAQLAACSEGVRIPAMAIAAGRGAPPTQAEEVGAAWSRELFTQVPSGGS